jgi:hypothetical protein
MSPGDRPQILVLGGEPRVAARHNSERLNVTLYGSPVINGNSNGRGLLDNNGLIADLENDPAKVLRQLDGEFVALIETPEHVIIASDRFSSHPVFYVVENDTLVISFSYQAIWNRLTERNALKIDPLAFYEFLHFQRLFAESTLDQSTKALQPATVLSFNRSTANITTSSYWSPNFEKRSDGRKAIARDLANAVRDSVTTKTRNSKKTVMLLSGGMDSRVVLGGFPRNAQPLCITIGEIENNEVDVARSLAGVAGAEHSFVQRSTSHYTDVVSEAVSAGGSMFSYQHGHFFDLDLPETDLILHGHGFDYFFQGMYLPSRRKTFLGRNTRSWALESIGFDLVGEYITKAKYRLKGNDPLSLLKPGLKEQAMDSLRSDLDSVLAPVQSQIANPHDQWDYLTTSAPGRHYTYLNLLSAGSLAEQRTIAFTNNILDIYHSTPAEVRHGTTLLAETLKHLNPRLLEVRNANTNLRPDRSPTRLTIDGWVRSAKRRIGMSNTSAADPSANDRSWPTDAMIVRNSPELFARIEKLPDSDGIGALDLFDESKLTNLVNTSRQSDNNAASALLSLLTIDEFLTSK